MCLCHKAVLYNNVSVTLTLRYTIVANCGLLYVGRKKDYKKFPMDSTFSWAKGDSSFHHNQSGDIISARSLS